SHRILPQSHRRIQDSPCHRVCGCLASNTNWQGPETAAAGAIRRGRSSLSEPTNRDRVLARGLPEIYLAQPWLSPRMRIAEAVDRFWWNHPLGAREELRNRLLLILIPLHDPRQVTPLLRERCEAAVVLWLQRLLPAVPPEATA